MMKHKRIAIALGLVLLTFITGLLTGCGGDSKPAATTTPAATATKPAAMQEDTLAAIMAKARTAPGFSYDMVMTAPGMSMTSKVWGVKDKMKFESAHEGKKMVTYIDGDTTYMYDPASNTAMKFSSKEMDMEKGMKPDNPSAYEDGIAKDTLKFVENVVYEGVKCRVVTFTSKDDGTAAKMWLREDYGLPMRQEMTSKKGEKFTIEYKNMKIGALPPDTFKLPAGAKIQDMSEMMKNMPKGAK